MHTQRLHLQLVMLQRLSFYVVPHFNFYLTHLQSSKKDFSFLEEDLQAGRITKEKAQEFIGLGMNQLRKEKEEFLKTIVPEWNKKAKERESKWKVVVMN